MLPEERKVRIAQTLQKEGAVTVKELATFFGVSEVTIRKDLAQLQNRQLLKRTYGGAISTGLNELGLLYSIRASKHRHEKEKIGVAAAALVKKGDTVILDSGSTNMEIARHLKGVGDLTVITNTLNIAMELGGSSGINVIVTGGTFYSPSLSFIGPQAERSVQELNVDKAFVSVNGISVGKGLTIACALELGVKRSVINAAREVFVAADSSKFGRAALAFLAPINVVRTIITDSKVSRREIRALQKKGIDVVIA